MMPIVVCLSIGAVVVLEHPSGPRLEQWKWGDRGGEVCLKNGPILNISAHLSGAIWYRSAPKGWVGTGITVARSEGGWGNSEQGGVHGMVFTL
jgi:hypothetical protein